MNAALLLKLTLAPVLVAGATLMGRRHGQRLSGWLVGFPIVAGPILFLYCLEQGTAFGAAAAEATLSGLVSLSAFVLAYAWGSLVLPWWLCLPAGWLVFGAVTTVLRHASVPWTVALPAVWVALGVTWWGLPLLRAVPLPKPASWDLPTRMAATLALVLALTGAAPLLGPRLSGLLTPFPVASTVLTVFAHSHGGPAQVEAVFKGFLPGLYGFALFCSVLTVALPQMNMGAAFGLALLGVAIAQSLALKWIQRNHNRTL